MVVCPEELTPIQRGGLVSHWLTQGDAITAKEAARLVGYQRPREGQRLLERLSQVLPIYEHDDGYWEMCECAEIP